MTSQLSFPGAHYPGAQDSRPFFVTEITCLVQKKQSFWPIASLVAETKSNSDQLYHKKHKQQLHITTNYMWYVPLLFVQCPFSILVAVSL